MSTEMKLTSRSTQNSRTRKTRKNELNLDDLMKRHPSSFRVLLRLSRPAVRPCFRRSQRQADVVLRQHGGRGLRVHQVIKFGFLQFLRDLAFAGKAVHETG